MTSRDEYNFILSASLNEIKSYIQHFNDGARNNNILTTCAQYGRIEIVKHMVESGHIRQEIPLASPTVLDYAIVNAAANGHLNVVKYLVAHGWNPKVNDNEPFRQSATHGKLEVVKYLASLGAYPDCDINHALRWSAANGHLGVVKYLIENLKYDPRCSNDEPLRNAAENGHWNIVHYLIDLGCDPRSKEDFVLMMASRFGNFEMVVYLISLGCDPRSQNDTALMLSVNDEHFELTGFLIHLGCDPTSQSFDAIHLCLNSGCDNMAKYLFSLLSRKNQYQLLPFLNRNPQEFVNRNMICMNKNFQKHNPLLHILKPKSLRMQMILIA
jgi:ankyrin repeat protein